MEAYKLVSTDMMGLPINVEYYLNLNQALKKFDEKIEEYRKSKYLASEEDIQEHNISSESISINEKHPDYIKSAMICLWYKCSYEYDEWDITVEHLELEKINLQD